MLFYDAADELQRLQSVEKDYNSMKRQNEWYDSRLTTLIESHNNLIQVVADRDEGIRWNRARRKLLESQVKQLRAEVEQLKDNEEKEPCSFSFSDPGIQKYCEMVASDLTHNLEVIERVRLEEAPDGTIMTFRQGKPLLETKDGDNK
jgi:chromosome segregation ATPase